jgi:hypothetical protein
MNAVTLDAETAALRDQLAEVLTKRFLERAKDGVEDSPEGHCRDLAEAVLPLWPNPDTLLRLVVKYGAARSKAADAAHSGFSGDVRRYDAEADAIYSRIRAALAGEQVGT